MRLFRLVSPFVILVGFLFSSARATSVIAPTFAELVAEADTIVRGTVTHVEARSVTTTRGPAVYTYVTLAIEQCAKGTAPQTLTLTLLGGTSGAQTLSIAGMPQFAIGDREIVFVQRNGRQLCPLVGFYHGRYRILKDPATQRDYVARDNRTPLTGTGDVSLPLLDASRIPAAHRTSTVALGPDEFLAQVRTQLDSLPPHVRVP